MANVSGSCAAYSGVSHKYGFQFNINASRSSESDPNLHITGTLNAGAWDLYSTSWEGTALTGTFYVASSSHSYNVYHAAFGQGNSGTLFNTTNIDFYISHPSSDNITVWGDCANGTGDSSSGSWTMSNVPTYKAAETCSPGTTPAFGNSFPTIPTHNINPNTITPLPENLVLDKRFNGEIWDTIYHKTREDNIYKYPPIIRSLSSNYGENDQFNIPFDVDESEIAPEWVYYDNTYFYIYKDGLYDVSCSTMVVDRAQGIGPTDCGRNVDGNEFAWLKIAKNPEGSNCTTLAGKVAWKYDKWLNINVHSVIHLNAGDKVFARFGWQYGNTNTSSGTSIYDMHCTIGGGIPDKTTRIMITPLIFLDQDIIYN